MIEKAKTSPDKREIGKCIDGLYKKGQWYYYKFDYKGTTYQGSTKLESHDDAVIFLEDLKEDLRRGKKPEKLRRKSISFNGILNKWLDHNSHKSDKHLSSTITQAKHIQKLYGKWSLHRINTEAVLDLRSIYLRDHAKTSWNLCLRTLKMLMNYGKALGYIDKLPFDLKQEKSNPKVYQPIASHNVNELLQELGKQTNGEAKQVYFLMGITMGLRDEEIRLSRVTWIDAEDLTYTVAGVTKSHQNRTLDLQESLCQRMLALPRPLGCPLIFAGKGTRPYAKTYFYQAIVKAGKALGIKISPHHLRANFATNSHNAGATMDEVRRDMGHSSVTVTERYVIGDLKKRRQGQRRMVEALKIG